MTHPPRVGGKLAGRSNPLAALKDDGQGNRTNSEHVVLLANFACPSISKVLGVKVEGKWRQVHITDVATKHKATTMAAAAVAPLTNFPYLYLNLP